MHEFMLNQCTDNHVLMYINTHEELNHKLMITTSATNKDSKLLID